MEGTQTDVNEQKDPEQSEQNNEEHQEKKTKEVPKITNDNVKTDPVRKVVNKKLSTMSKETKEGKKNRKRPLKPPKDEFALPDINPMYLLTFIGIVIAGISLYYTRKTAMKDEEEVEDAREWKIQWKIFLRQRPCTAKKKKQGIKGPDHLDAFYAQRHKNTGIFTFDD